MPDQNETLGLIAGNRSLPLLFAKQARAMGAKRLVAVTFENETDPSVQQRSLSLVISSIK